MIELVEMPGERFPAYRENLIREYAREKVKAGAWSPEEAPRLAESGTDDLLAQGTETEGHHLYLLRDQATEKEVGLLWIAVRDSGVGKSVWIYDIEIYEEFRREGHATRALQALERKASNLGAERLELHVFGHNAGARTLYERSGFTPTSIVMSKQLDGR